MSTSVSRPGGGSAMNRSKTRSHLISGGIDDLDRVAAVGEVGRRELAGGGQQLPVGSPEERRGQPAGCQNQPQPGVGNVFRSAPLTSAAPSGRGHRNLFTQRGVRHTGCRRPGAAAWALRGPGRTLELELRRRFHRLRAAGHHDHYTAAETSGGGARNALPIHVWWG